jgi:hypothetical protein
LMLLDETSRAGRPAPQFAATAQICRGKFMSRVTGRKKRIIITTAAMLAVGTGAAFAYWSGTGTTSATAGAGKSVPFKVSSTVSAGLGRMTPGGPSQSAEFTIKNENTGVQNLSGLVVKVANADGTPWTSVKGCSADDFEVSPPAFNIGQGIGQIAANTTVSGTVSIQMVNLDRNQDGCQGVFVPLYFAAS